MAPRYSITPGDMYDDPRITDGHLRVMGLFGRCSDANGWLQANQRNIAEKAGRSRETINRMIRELVEFGYLRKRQRFSGKDGRQLINEYQVLMDRSDRDDCVVSEPSADGNEASPCDPHVTPPCDVQITGGVTSGDHTPCDLQRSHHKNDPFLQRPFSPSLEGGRASAPNEREPERETDFEQIRKAWPTGFVDSREDALEAWHSLTNAEQRDALDEVGRFVSTTRSAGRKFFGTLAAYLSERKWQALPDKPKPVDRAALPDAKPPVARPTAFQRANPHLYPKLFPEPPPAAAPGGYRGSSPRLDQCGAAELRTFSSQAGR